jgi:putative ABC transport system permease protein
VLRLGDAGVLVATLVPPVAVIGGLAAALLISAIAGLYPAIRATRLSPTEVLHTT